MISGVCAPDSPIQPRSKPFSVNLGLIESGNVVAGSLEVTGPSDPCTSAPSPTETIVIQLSATTSGSTLTGTTVLEAGKVGRFSATVNGSSMDVTITRGDGENLSGTLTQVSTQTPATGFSGTYAGTYNSTVNAQSTNPAHPGCVNLTGSVTSSGPFTATIAQIGNVATAVGSLTGRKTYLDDGRGHCTIGTEDDEGSFSGTITGNVFTAPNFREGTNEVNGSVTVTLSGNTLSGSLITDREQTTFTGTRTTATPPAFPPALINTFSVDPSTINAGDSTKLSWSTLNTSGVTIDNGSGARSPSGSISVSPKQTTTYTLTATGPASTARASATVTVVGAGPRIVVSTFPSGMVQATGTAGATDSISVSNVGTAAADVTLTQNGTFFTIAPTSFTIPAGGSQVVTITAKSQQAGSYDGSINVSNSIDVPVHLLVAAPPTAPVIPQAIPRSDVSAPAGQNPTGTISVTNNGTGTLQGIAVSDVPWIIPQSGLITIGPGQTTQIGFTVDRSQRPDTASLVGALSGRITLVYLTSASGKTALGATPTGSVSVTIVDVVKPNVASGTPSALNPGELAYFIDALRTNSRFNGDLMLSSKNGVPDLRLFLAAQGQQQIGNLPAIPSNVGIAFPAVIKNVFGLTGLGGSLQVRSSDNLNVALSAVVSTNVSTAAISSITALPILRSDRSIGAGERLVFTGADNSTTDATSTSIFIQEVTGNAGHVSFEYRDLNGNVVGTDGTAIGPFAFVTGDVPAAARSIILTNDSSGSARVTGFASVIADGSGDSWILLDSRQFGAASGSLIIPMFAAGSQTDVYIANPSNAAANVTVDVGSGNRRHSVRISGGGQATPQSVTIGPMSTSRMTLSPTNGY
ncbi:MAG: hypothetical protein DMF59_02550, partial [Acidobacteria bacterium]